MMRLNSYLLGVLAATSSVAFSAQNETFCSKTDATSAKICEYAKELSKKQPEYVFMDTLNASYIVAMLAKADKEYSFLVYEQEAKNAATTKMADLPVGQHNPSMKFESDGRKLSILILPLNHPGYRITLGSKYFWNETLSPLTVANELKALIKPKRGDTTTTSPAVPQQ